MSQLGVRLVWWRSGRKGLLRGAFLLGLAGGLVAAPGPALAQSGAEVPKEIQAPRFLIETITVEGTRREASQGILLEESLLEAGQTYSERELRDAIYRIRRLPFVLSADFSLRRGTERGTYELVIAVQETTRFFFGHEGTFFVIADRSAAEALGYRAEALLEVKVTAGLRLFAGSRGVVFGAVSENTGVHAGYTRYGLLGSRAVVNLVGSKYFCCPREVFPLGIDPGVTAISTRESTRF
ncbi:MAG TPA: hypothetical protein VHN15_14010, partial [Thermoanaerobaculia bacterium]|nr:hypothetical protein [Thermoanaerobaculia bacterium]